MHAGSTGTHIAQRAGLGAARRSARILGFMRRGCRYAAWTTDMKALALLLLLCAQAQAAEPACSPEPGNAFLRPCQAWAAGVEGQRKADLGTGFYLNPILAGDHPDPSILKDGDDYYMTFSSFEAYPGLTIWHSRDLVNWQPIASALTDYIGSVWAP